MNTNYADHSFLLAGAGGIKLESRFLERLDPAKTSLTLILSTKTGHVAYGLTPTPDAWFEVELLGDYRDAMPAVAEAPPAEVAEPADIGPSTPNPLPTAVEPAPSLEDQVAAVMANLDLTDE